ncbi:MAG: hypothetical protein ACREJN_12550 [Nitrospiraceae bacterium]
MNSMEPGGSEDPAEEVRLAKKLQEDQENWARTESRVEHPILLTALELFRKSGFPLDRVTLKFLHEDGIAHTILDETCTGGYQLIVVSRHGSKRVNLFFDGSITDQLLGDAPGDTLWVME